VAAGSAAAATATDASATTSGGARLRPAAPFSLDFYLVFTKLISVTSALEALGTPRRREILRLVWDAERRAGQIHEALPDVTFGAVSQHLRVLREQGLVDCRREGRERLYRARKKALGPLRSVLQSMWDDALYRLKLQAELEESRRGPRPAPERRRP